MYFKDDGAVAFEAGEMERLRAFKMAIRLFADEDSPLRQSEESDSGEGGEDEVPLETKLKRSMELGQTVVLSQGELEAIRGIVENAEPGDFHYAHIIRNSAESTLGEIATMQTGEKPSVPSGTGV